MDGEMRLEQRSLLESESYGHVFAYSNHLCIERLSA
jgi:hypothetical protein